jgi:hypothetical protein
MKGPVISLHVLSYEQLTLPLQELVYSCYCNSLRINGFTVTFVAVSSRPVDTIECAPFLDVVMR